MSYHEEETLEFINVPEYTTKSIFNYKCAAMFFNDIKFRFRYYMDVTKPITGKFTNSSKSYVPKPEDEEIDYIIIKKSPGYRHHFQFQFGKELDGMQTNQALMYTNETYETDLYDNWQFKDPEKWDNFWFEAHTNKLF